MTISRSVLALTILAGWLSHTAVHAATHAVEVASNYLTPARVNAEVGDTVRWVARHAGHALVADDGRFRFPASGTFDSGDSASFTITTDDEWIRYHCVVHPEMIGAIKVGDPAPVGGGSPTEIRAVPAQYPTIADALDGIPVGAAIVLGPGVYDAAVVVRTEGVRLIGDGPSPAAVVLRGGGARGVGVSIRASSVRIENLTVSGFTIAGIDLTDADHSAVARVTVDAASEGARGSYGIRVRASRYARIEEVEVSNAARAGISVDGCGPCDLVVRRSLVRASTVGVAADRASSVVLRDSVIGGNTTGLAITNRGAGELQGGFDVVGNTFRSNVRAFAARPGFVDLAAGVGVWIDGVAHVRVIGNVITDHRYGIALTGRDGPSLGSSILQNQISASREADLAWDGIGLGTCFSRNLAAAVPASSEPPQMEQLYPCGGLAPRPGVPFPLVTAKVLLAE